MFLGNQLFMMAVWRRQQFSITWRRVGEWYCFRQTVLATSAEEARGVAFEEMKKALGANREHWVIADIQGIVPGSGQEPLAERKVL